MLSRLGGWGCAMMLLTCAAWSQEPSSTKQSHLSADIYAGYSFVAPNFEDVYGGPGEKGGTAGFDLHLKRSLAVAAETDWMHVVYGTQESSTAFTVMAGPRVFFPSGSHARIKMLADVLVGAVDIHSLTGVNSLFTRRTVLAISADAGVELRAIGPLALRVEGGYLHSGFTTQYPADVPQYSIHNQHGRLLIECVWRF